MYPTRTKTSSAAALAAFLFLGAVAALSLALLRPPAAVPEGAPPAEFSSGRAMKHLREIARAPHPTGTQEHDRVREYIMRELAALGVAPEVQETTAVVRAGRAAGAPFNAARVRNVVARLGGTSNTRALMLAAHYDSVPTARGATDDGAGVVTLLETLRALKSGPPVRNDIIFLFTDAEELGLLGAHAFADEHPWMRDAALVLNFEGRGNSGPSMMFETSDGNRALVRELARAAPHTIANSLMYAVYERMPNDTDMTVFKRAGAAGLNFAYTHEVTHYHTMLDGPEETDERSLQHHGTYALSLARRFGDLDLGRDLPAGDGDAVYFNALGSLFIHYPQSLVWPLTVLVTIAFVFVILVGLRGKLLSPRGIAWGFAALFVAAVAAAAATTLAWWAARRLHPGFESLPWGAPYNMGLYEVGFVLLTTALTASVYALFARRASAPNLLAGALLWWLLLLLPATVLLPPGTFIFAWPLLFSLAGLAFVLKLCDGSYAPTKSIAALALCAVPCVVLMAPLVHMSFVMLGVGPAGFYMILTALALGLCAPLLTLLTAAKRWTFPVALALAAFVLITAAILTAGFDTHRRRTSSLFYHLDADRNEARWMSTDRTLDRWTASFIGDGAVKESLAGVFPWSRQQAWKSAAPALPLPAPLAEVGEDDTRGDVRLVRLRLESPRRAPLLLVHFDAETEVTRASIDGKTLTGADADSAGALPNPPRVSFAAPPAEGIELTLQVRASRPLKLAVRDVSYELPVVPGQSLPPRPPDSMPPPSSLAGETTVVSKTYDFENR